MKKDLICAILLLVAGCLSSCSGESGQKKSQSSSLGNGRSGKGRIFERVNIVQIPLTAAELSLRGKVKSVTYREYLLIPKDGQQLKRLMTRGYNVYDALGHLVDQNEYDYNDRPKWKCTYTYSPDGKRVEWHFIFYEQPDESRTTFSYDEKGNVAEQVEYNKEGVLSQRTVYKYDNDGNKVEEATYGAKGELNNVVTYKYDKNGNQVEYMYKSGEGSIVNRITAVYDASGYKLSGEEFEGDSLKTKWTQKNNKAGFPLEVTTLKKDGTLFSKYIYKYDKLNNVISEESYNPDGTKENKWSGTSAYEYDKTGNIIRQTDYEMQDGKLVPKTYIETDYTYHK